MTGTSIWIYCVGCREPMLSGHPDHDMCHRCTTTIRRQADDIVAQIKVATARPRSGHPTGRLFIRLLATLGAVAAACYWLAWVIGAVLEWFR